ncbi:MAG: hypothetical protein QOH36_1517 [Actinomycetota bacterium]|jgi:hypothetical protein|nr:hypothetical protein [Actinomycetota bacterium]
MTRELRLGVDIGRVIIDGSSHPSGDDTAFFKGGLQNALLTPPVDQLFDALPRLVTLFEHRVWLISKCGQRVQDRSLAWLDHHDFYDRTGIARDNVRFCRQRPEKAIHCRELGITDLVDDRVDVHEAVRGIVRRSYLFGPQDQPAPSWLIAATTWPALEAAVASNLASNSG